MAPPSTAPFLDYFRKTFAGENALFPITQWNVHDATLTGKSRTNNICEGYNHAFSVSVPNQNHPVIWKVKYTQ